MNLTLAELALPLRIRPDRPLTDEEFLEFCQQNEPFRMEREANGEVIVMSPGGIDGGGMELDVGAELRSWAQTDGRGRAYGPSTGTKLSDGSVRAADASWISSSRLNALTAEQRRRYGPICPEFVIELRSPTDRLPLLQAKMEQWIASGAELAWLIDPLEKTVYIYRAGIPPEVYTDPTSIQGIGIIAGFELILSRVWG